MEFMDYLNFGKLNYVMQIEAPYITPFYAGLCGLLLVYLSRRVVSLRNKHQIKMGDGGHAELTAAVRAQDSLIEYLPTALIIMFMAEMLAYSALIIHTLGVLLVASRLMHIQGSKAPSGQSRLRRIATRLTWTQITLASLLCILATFGFVF